MKKIWIKSQILTTSAYVVVSQLCEAKSISCIYPLFTTCSHSLN